MGGIVHGMSRPVATTGRRRLVDNTGENHSPLTCGEWAAITNTRSEFKCLTWRSLNYFLSIHHSHGLMRGQELASFCRTRGINDVSPTRYKSRECFS